MQSQLKILKFKKKIKNLKQNKTKQNKKNNRMISIHFPGKPFTIMVIQVYAPTSNAEETEADGFMKTSKTF